ncbi:MAG: hypothetical protein ACKVS7_05530 [Gemmatimonadaceae bacterium]
MTQRRDFVRQASLLAAGSLAVGATELPAATRGNRSEAADARPNSRDGVPESADMRDAQAQTWDMSWVDRVTGKYRMVFDAPEIAGGVVLHQARSFIAGYATTTATPEKDITAIMTIRHAAVPMLMGDELWSDGKFGEKGELKDPETGEPTKRNPFINVAPGSKHALTWPDGALDTLMSRGVIVLACDIALNNYTGMIAQRRGIPRQDARDLVAKHLLKGVYRMPSGIFATSHAQQLGCGFMYAG